MTSSPRLIDELNALRASYVDAVNAAVAQDDVALAEELAGHHDREAILLMAEREGRQDLLPLFGFIAPRDTPLRRLARRFSTTRAA